MHWGVPVGVAVGMAALELMTYKMVPVGCSCHSLLACHGLMMTCSLFEDLQ